MSDNGSIPARARAVVIGGGVIGCSIAYHLTKIGVTDVLLLERKELTAGTTWHAAGLITSAGMPTETFQWMSRYTTELLPKLTEETGQDTGFRTIGHLRLACTPQRLETVTREALFAKGHGIPVEMVDAAEVKRLWPEAMVDDILAAAWSPTRVVRIPPTSRRRTPRTRGWEVRGSSRASPSPASSERTAA